MVFRHLGPFDLIQYGQKVDQSIPGLRIELLDPRKIGHQGIGIIGYNADNINFHPLFMKHLERKELHPVQHLIGAAGFQVNSEHILAGIMLLVAFNLKNPVCDPIQGKFVHAGILFEIVTFQNLFDASPVHCAEQGFIFLVAVKQDAPISRIRRGVRQQGRHQCFANAAFGSGHQKKF
ncbi:hypothetical protein SDC9_172219 [bioreactor metagenome]|uniref:Uncharacterized protein n=1 Tax=bioreactor metagenome TaxID=1076179 RepID=A0A645GDR7_9ZZZZ